MLGEDHSLFNDFPEKSDVINKLMETDPDFAAEAKRYHALDKEIRTLELRNSPIEDQAMQQLKHDRADMKDALYQRLLAGA
ncbi:DUF465 domain-containing protein [Seongchinamella sediminis]|uniref:DUF465 domain-containing protein n=1 Tax=Seongchinamella sediminis TaxID=2283635 RepID=A0A3L7DW44_9GAMM|nr:YdcH family protein [Seongchinamella sediminis]RLQ21787.1 DUF465 domain-containing protein [Seongchinamella sediminis]